MSRIMGWVTRNRTTFYTIVVPFLCLAVAAIADIVFHQAIIAIVIVSIGIFVGVMRVFHVISGPHDAHEKKIAVYGLYPLGIAAAILVGMIGVVIGGPWEDVLTAVKYVAMFIIIALQVRQITIVWFNSGDDDDGDDDDPEPEPVEPPKTKTYV